MMSQTKTYPSFPVDPLSASDGALTFRSKSFFHSNCPPLLCVGSFTEAFVVCVCACVHRTKKHLSLFSYSLSLFSPEVPFQCVTNPGFNFRADENHKGAKEKEREWETRGNRRNRRKQFFTLLSLTPFIREEEHFTLHARLAEEPFR